MPKKDKAKHKQQDGGQNSEFVEQDLKNSDASGATQATTEQAGSDAGSNVNTGAVEESAADSSSGQGTQSEGTIDQASQDTHAVINQLEQKIKELEEENSDLKNQYIRKQADFENFRKRMFREREEAVKYANSGLLSDLITIIDDFERAIKSSEDSKDFESFHSGIELIEKQFTGMLEKKWGLKRFESEGEEFDPQRHEAIGMEERGDIDSQIVLEDYQKGYMLHDRVLRHAKVKVSMPSSSGISSESSDEDTQEDETE